ncbi:MAG: helix-turn-helix transcriptional regulator [Clostridia bacterium]|nr:helix-turn-helix transcriptional regulator [Clostridia bacterium]
MNDLILYENVPKDAFPIHLVEYHSLPDDFALHWHEETEILFLRQGELTVRCGDKLITAEEGDCIVINGNELHEGVSGECDFLCLYLPPFFFEEQYYTFKHLIKDKIVNDTVLGIFEKYKDKKHTNILAVKGYAYLLISHLIANHTDATYTEGRYKKHLKTSERMNDAIRYIEQNCFENVSTKHLSKISHLSEGYFCHLFKAVTGHSAKEYVLMKRIDKAVDLLLSTDMTVLEIAMQCGFSDANYFSRIFKKYKGRTPSSYRR